MRSKILLMILQGFLSNWLALKTWVSVLLSHGGKSFNPPFCKMRLTPTHPSPVVVGRIR